MKNFINIITTKCRNTMNKTNRKVNELYINAQTALTSKSGEGYIDTGIKIIIGVVIGGVILAGLYAIFNKTIIPTMTSKITSMFSYTGK